MSPFNKVTEWYKIRKSAKVLRHLMETPDPWEKYGTETEPVAMSKKQFLAVVREVLRDMDGLADGSIDGVKKCSRRIDCLSCKDFFLCAYQQYAETEPDETVTCLYARDLEIKKNDPPTI